MGWSRLAVLWVVVFLSSGQISCSDDTFSTIVRVDLLFPEGSDPLESVESLRVKVLVEGGGEDLNYGLERPSSGSWSDLDEGIELGLVSYDGARIVVEGLDASGHVVSAGETISVPLGSGLGGRLSVFVQELGTSGLAPGFGRSWSRHGATYLDGGGVMVAGGGEDAATAEAWIYALDRYEPIALALMPAARSLLSLATLSGTSPLILGGSQPSSEALTYAPLGDSYTPVALPDEFSGSWARPLVAALSDGGVLALRDENILRIAAGPPAAASTLGQLPEGVRARSVTVLSPELAVVVGDGDPVAVGFDPSDGMSVTIAQPSGGARSDHGATALSDGRLVLAGGLVSEGRLAVDVEVYDPEVDEWELHADLLTGLERTGAPLVALADDRLILVGGSAGDGTPRGEAVVMDVDDGAVELIDLAVARREHTVSALPMGTVLIIGGEGEEGLPLDSVEVLRPSASN